VPNICCGPNAIGKDGRIPMRLRRWTWTRRLACSPGDICEATTDESTRSPSSTTAAAVSSQDDSMPRMRVGISFYGSACGLLFEEADEIARAQAGGAALAVALESGGDEDAAFGG